VDRVMSERHDYKWDQPCSACSRIVPISVSSSELMDDPALIDRIKALALDRHMRDHHPELELPQ
jgi:hypothetical protein